MNVAAILNLSLNLAYLFLLPIDQMAASKSAAADAVKTIFPFGGSLIAAVIAVSVIGTAGIYTLSAPRIYFAGFAHQEMPYLSNRAGHHPAVVLGNVRRCHYLYCFFCCQYINREAFTSLGGFEVK